MLDPEAVAQRRRQQAGPRRGADEREGRQVERHDLRPRALPDRDRQPAVLHRGVEGLLQRAVEAVDLVHEEHRAGLERGQQRGDVALALERGPGRLDEGHVELVGQDLRQRGLAQARRPGQQDVVERLAAPARGREGDLELGPHRLLPDELVERGRAQGALELVLARVEDPGRLDARHAAHRRAARRALARRSSGVSPAAAARRRSASGGAKPSSTRPSRASRRGSSGSTRRGVGVPADGVGVRVAERRDDLLAQLDDDPLGRPLADARHGGQPRDVAGRQRAPRARAGRRRRGPRARPSARRTGPR